MRTARQQYNQSEDGTCSDQDEAIAFLSDPKSYDPPVNSVTRIDTHSAIVFLAGARAYKIKRAVRYAYLDFSTLENRRKFCAREIIRNSATAPGIYVAAAPLVRTPRGGLALNKMGEPIEWVVVMNRFDQSQLFDNLVQRGGLAKVDVNQLADKIAEYHSWARPVRDFDCDRWFEQTVSAIVAKLSGAAGLINLDSVKTYSRLLLQHQNSARILLRERARGGMVRLCHGDLHLKNIVLFEGQPTLIDSIEFDDEIATQDVLYDFAFVLMDFLARDAREHANLLLNKYLSHLELQNELSCLKVLPLFMSLRAGIRTMVCLDQLPFSGNSRRNVEAEVKNYFKLSTSLLKDHKPCLLAMGGRSGTGKSTLAERIAPMIGCAAGAIHLRSDVERKQMFGVVAEKKLAEQAYTTTVNDAVYRRLLEKAHLALQAGHAVILDATFLSSEHRRLAARLGKKMNVNFIGLWLDAEINALKDRVQKRTGDASDADAAVVRQQFESDPGVIDWHVIDAGTDRDAVYAAAIDVVAAQSQRPRNAI